MMGYLINTDDMRGESGTYREKEAHLEFWWGNEKKISETKVLMGR